MAEKDFIELIYFFHDAILAGFMVGLLLGVAGVYLHFRRNIFLAAVLPQVAGFGYVFAGVLEINEILGAFISIIVFIVAMTLHNRNWEKIGITKECIIGAGLVISVALNVILASISAKETHSAELLAKGSILTATCNELYELIAFGIPIIWLLFILKKHLFFIYLDPEGASAHGYNIGLYEAVFYISVSFIIMLTVKASGATACFSLLLFSPLVAMVISKSSYYIFLISGITGGLASLFGVILAIILDLPAGPTIILSSFAILLLVLSTKIIAGLLKF